ncbi:MAG: ABC transporter substrate-binding protein [Flavobacteriales bacterium]|nr:ABC transporter substrate-binding protein [Flavobacteriales bacterium]
MRTAAHHVTSPTTGLGPDRVVGSAHHRSGHRTRDLQRRLSVAWYLSLVLVLSCGAPTSDPGHQVFRYNESEGITSLDPVFARNLEHIWVVDQLFDGLVEMGPDMRVRPAVARSWDIRDSGTAYLFHLRPEVRFHDDPVFPDGMGRSVTANDFVFSLERLRDERTASPGRWVLDHVLPGPAGIAARDDSTLILHLDRPFAPFLSMLAMAYCSVVPREAVQRYGAHWREHPVGCGPFQLFVWKEGVKLVLHGFPNYYGRDAQGERLPHLDAVSIGFIKDPSAEFLGLVKGEIDMISGAEGGFLNELLDPLGRVRDKYADRITELRAPALATDYLGFQMDTSLAIVRGTPWQDVRLRQAIACAIDRDRIVEHIRHGFGRPAKGIVPPAMPGAASRGQRYDPERARALLAEAGHPNGEGLPALTLTATSDYLDLCAFVQHALAGYGIELLVNIVPLSTHKEGVANGDLIFFRKNWIADYPDAENFLLLFESDNCAPAGPNYTRFSDPTYDALYERALRTDEGDVRTLLYQRMDSLVSARAPAVFILHPEVVRFVRRGVTGLVADPMNQLDLRRVRKDR